LDLNWWFFLAIDQVKGELLESYERIDIFSGFPYNLYLVKDSSFTPQEKQLIDFLAKKLVGGQISSEFVKQLDSKEIQQFLRAFESNVVSLIDLNYLNQKFGDLKTIELVKLNLELLLEDLSIVKNKSIVCEEILNKSIGYRELGVFVEDDFLEEIMINGYGKPVFVLHKKYGVCKTNVLVEEKGFLSGLINKIALTVEKKFDEFNPLLDARLPDGSRVNATIQQVSPKGPSLTIRKFSKNSLSLIKLVEFGTLNSELAAFLWVMVEGIGIEPMNLIVTGGTSSGKTVLLNVLATLIPYNNRIITIEDTLELSLGSRENWIQLESRPKIGTTSEVSMNDLLKNSLRMRPDRIIVGEVRSEEAQTLFTAMDTGHRGCMGTLHSNTAREMLLRLKTPPMSVSESMLPLLNLVVVMERFYEPKKGVVRRVKELAEISRMEEQVLLANLFEYDRLKDKILKTDLPSHLIELLSERVSMTKNELKQEIEVRKRLIDWMLAKGISDMGDVEEIFQRYYLDPAGVLEKLSKYR